MDFTVAIISISACLVISGIVLAVWINRRAAAIKPRPQPSAELQPINPAQAAGITWKASHRSRSRNTPASVTVRADYPFKAPINFRAESGADRFGKTIGLASEVQTGDSLFDDAIYVDSPYAEYASRMLGDSDNRRALRRCFAAYPKLKKIACGPQGCDLLFSPAERSEVPESMIAEVLAALPGLRQSVERLEIRRNVLSERIGLVVIVVTTVLGGLGFIPLMIGFIAFESLDGGIFIPGLLAGLGGGLVYALLAWLVLRGRSGALVPFLLALTIGLLDFSQIGIGAVHIANGLLDQSEPQIHQVTITDRYTSRSKNSTSYYVQFDSWSQKVSGNLSVGYDLYERLQPGSKLAITTSAGGLGYERLISLE